MKNLQIDRTAFLDWAGPAQRLLEGRGRVQLDLDASSLPAKSELHKVIPALNSGETVDLINRYGKVIAHVELTKDGYVETPAVS